MQRALGGPVCARRTEAAKCPAGEAQDRGQKPGIGLRAHPDLDKLRTRRYLNEATLIRERDRQAGAAQTVSTVHPPAIDHLQSGLLTVGHYRSRGAASHLRYNEDNANTPNRSTTTGIWAKHRQYQHQPDRSKHRLLPPEALEADNDPAQTWTHDELRAIRDTRPRVKVLKREAAHA